MIKLNDKIVNIGKFPNGEIYVDIDNKSISTSQNHILLKYENSDDIIALIFLKSKLDEVVPRAINILTMPYLPYSRMDREEEDRLFTLKYFANIVNNLEFNLVYCYEIHNEKSVELFDKLENIKMTAPMAQYTMDGIDETVLLVFPDKGAQERYKNDFKGNDKVTYEKKRDFNTGKILSIELSNNEYIDVIKKYKTAIIVDDLCSKGGTFVSVAKDLRKHEIETIYLCVAHTENKIFEGDVFKYIDKVITSNSILDERHAPIEIADKIKVVYRF